jgi:hypothetical protein
MTLNPFKVMKIIDGFAFFFCLRCKLAVGPAMEQASSGKARPATAHGGRALTPAASKRPASAARPLPARPQTSHGAHAELRGRQVGKPRGSVQDVLKPSLKSLEGLGWDYYQQHEKVSRLKERIAQLELKLLAESKAAAGAGAANAAAAELPTEERELLEALQWARSEAEVFENIDMEMKPSEKAFTAVLQQMLANAGAGGAFPEPKVAAMAKEVFVKHANSFTRRLDLQRLRALVVQQHQERARKHIEDWVRSSTGYQEHVIQCVQKTRAHAPLREAVVGEVVKSLDNLQTDIGRTMLVSHRAHVARILTCQRCSVV